MTYDDLIQRVDNIIAALYKELRSDWFSPHTENAMCGGFLLEYIGNVRIVG
jgi:hypothetical protein